MSFPIYSAIGARGAVYAPPAGSTYDNLANWPSVDNRPTFSGSTLSWIGPTGGGSSTTSDVAQQRVLSNVSSAISSSNGQVIEGLNIAGTLTINHDNVTVKQCRVYGGGYFPITFGSGVTGAVFEDCLFDGVGGTQYQGISEGSFVTVRRCNLLNYENHITGGVSNYTIVDCLFHAAAGPDADMVECYGGSADTLIQHNTFDGRDTNAGAALNSAVNCSNYLGSVTNIQVINNAFLSVTSAHVINDDNGFGGGAVSWSCQNNGFYNSTSHSRDDVAPSPNSGNFVMATTTATSGSLVNGTGQI